MPPRLTANMRWSSFATKVPVVAAKPLASNCVAARPPAGLPVPEAQRNGMIPDSAGAGHASFPASAVVVAWQVLAAQLPRLLALENQAAAQLVDVGPR